MQNILVYTNCVDRSSLNQSLLPVGKGEFAKKEYWESFFKQRGNKAFEWYGEYTNLVGILTKYVKQKDKLFVVGCGNSDLSVDLYDIHQCHDITNLDISSVVIRQMVEKHCSKGKRPGLRYILGDICNEENVLECDNEEKSQRKSSIYSCIIDKGTLDAMHSDGENSLPKVEAMFRVIEELLRIGGRYICISLAQEHIVKALMDHFAEKSPYWLTRVHMLARDTISNDSSEFPLPVFAFVFTKFTASDKFRPIFEVQQNELTNDKMLRLQSSQQLLDWIDQQQNIALMMNSLSDQKETHCSFMSASTNQVYCVCYVIQNPQPMNAGGDSKQKRRKGKQRQLQSQPDKGAPIIPYAVFIVPVGSHDHSTFQSESSRLDLCVSASCGRLFLVLLNPQVYYKSKEKIQDTLDSIALQFSPSGLDTTSFKIPYMTCGPTTYPLEEIESGVVPGIGRFLIEEGSTLGRLLIFPDSNFQQIQLTDQPNCTRNECLQILISSISEALSHINTVLYYGLPKYSDPLKNMNVKCFPCQNFADYEQMEALRNVFDKYFQPDSVAVDFVSTSEDCNFLIYDPISVSIDDYALNFNENSLLSIMSSLSDKSVILLLVENAININKENVKSIILKKGFSILIEDTVRDVWLGDQDSSFCEIIIACNPEYRQEFVSKLLDHMTHVDNFSDLNTKILAKLKENISY